MREHGVEVVLDVGANIGQYAGELRAAGFAGTIVSFEPLGAAFDQLAKRAAADRQWHCHNLALGESAGSLKLNVSRNSVSSSFLPATSALIATLPAVEYIGAEDVQVSTLDTLCLDLLDRSTLLKLDVQGYELSVLRGARNSLSAMSLIELELSITRLYEGQPTMREMLVAMKDFGFELVSLEPGFSDPETGKLLQLDGTFARLGESERW